jgi:toxin ParE1/3/4
MKIEWASSALENLKVIHSEVEMINAGAAVTVLNQVLDEVDGLASSPFSGREGRIQGTRELPLVSTPIVVPYRVLGDAVQILAVLQGAGLVA